MQKCKTGFVGGNYKAEPPPGRVEDDRTRLSRGFGIQWLLVTLNSTDLGPVAAALMPTHYDKKAWDQKINLVVIEGPPSRFYLQNFERTNASGLLSTRPQLRWCCE